MVSWTEKKTYYYGALNDDPYFPIEWKNAPTLYDAIMRAKRLVPGSDLEQVEIQTRPQDPPVGARIPAYRVGCVTKDFKGRYVFALYTGKSFNARVYSKDYLIKGKDIIEMR